MRAHHYRYAIAQNVGFLHGVRGEHDGAARLGGLDDVPRGAAADGVHARGRLVQVDDGRVACRGNRTLSLGKLESQFYFQQPDG